MEIITARLPNTVMTMAPAINEYMAAWTPSGLSFGGQDPFPYSEQSNVSFRKEKQNLMESCQIIDNIFNFICIFIKTQDLKDSRKIINVEILLMIFPIYLS